LVGPAELNCWQALGQAAAPSVLFNLPRRLVGEGDGSRLWGSARGGRSRWAMRWVRLAVCAAAAPATNQQGRAGLSGIAARRLGLIESTQESHAEHTRGGWSHD